MSHELPHADFCLLLIICELSLFPASYCMLQPTQLYCKSCGKAPKLLRAIPYSHVSSPVFLEWYFPNISLALLLLNFLVLMTWTVFIHTIGCFVSQLATHFQFGGTEPVVRKKIGFQAMSCMFLVVAVVAIGWYSHENVSSFLTSPEHADWEFLWQKWTFVITFLNFRGHPPQTYPYFISVISMFNNIVTPYPFYPLLR